MSISFLTPLGTLIAIVLALPLAVLLLASRRAGQVRRIVGLAESGVLRRLVVPAVALVLGGVLVALAAAQPVLDRTVTRRVRSDAEVFFVVDVSRSMLASPSPGDRTRLMRAKEAAARMRAALPGVPVGIASLTDRVMPHLFPSSDEDVFYATLERSIDIERPPPRSSFNTNATSFDALTAVASRSFFSPDAQRRLLVVMTDGESVPVAAAALGRRFRRPPAIDLMFVQVWGADERVFTRGVPEPRYRADPSASSTLDALAGATDGSVYSEHEVDAAARKARDVLGGGPTVAQGVRRERRALAPFLAAAAFLPLALLLWYRDR